MLINGKVVPRFLRDGYSFPLLCLSGYEIEPLGKKSKKIRFFLWEDPIPGSGKAILYGTGHIGHTGVNYVGAEWFLRVREKISGSGHLNQRCTRPLSEIGSWAFINPAQARMPGMTPSSSRRMR
jgi:hypothetical protein